MSTVEETSSFWLATDNQDLTAINAYMHSQPLNNAESKVLFDDWVSWYEGLGFFDLHVNDGQTYDTARNKRNAFNVANATSDAERAQIQAVITAGQTSEQDAGQTDRRNSKGAFPEKPWWDILPTWAKYAAAGTAVVTIVLSAVSFSAVKAYKP